MMSPELHAALHLLQLSTKPHRILVPPTWTCRSHWKSRTILINFFILFSLAVFWLLSSSVTFLKQQTISRKGVSKKSAATAVCIHWKAEVKYSFQISSNLGEVQIFLGLWFLGWPSAHITAAGTGQKMEKQFHEKLWLRSVLERQHP